MDTGVDETGITFEENALLKARAAGAGTGVLALADDSGIEIDALGGAPGIHSARWTEERDWIPRVLRELDGVPPEERTARFVSAAAAVWPDGRAVVRRGVVEGHISAAARGLSGFGYDPIFVPDRGRRAHVRRDDGRREARPVAPRPRLPGAARRAGRHQPLRSIAQRLQDPAVAHEVGLLVQGHRGVDVGGNHPDAVARPWHGGARLGRERDVLVGAEPHGGTLDGRVAVVHAEALQAGIAHGPLRAGGDDRGLQVEGLAERAGRAWRRRCP